MFQTEGPFYVSTALAWGQRFRHRGNPGYGDGNKKLFNTNCVKSKLVNSVRSPAPSAGFPTSQKQNSKFIMLQGCVYAPLVLLTPDCTSCCVTCSPSHLYLD